MPNTNKHDTEIRKKLEIGKKTILFSAPGFRCPFPFGRSRQLTGTVCGGVLKSRQGERFRCL
eukprot:8868526-Pyramimonas_sp.AAC.1